MQPKRNLSESAKHNYVPQQTVGQPPVQPTRSQHAPPTFFQGYPPPTRGPPSSGMPPSRFGYPPPPPSRQPYPPERDDKHPRGEPPRYDNRSAPQMQGPPVTSAYAQARPRASSYGYAPQPGYAGGPPRAGPPPPRQGGGGGSQVSPPEGRYPPPPYGAPPPYIPVPPLQQRSTSWGTTKGERYPSHAPYTSAQRNGEKPPGEPKEKKPIGETVVSNNGSVPPFRLIGDGPPKKQQPPYPYPRVDVDAMAYKVVEGRDGATSPSQIESNRRDDVTNMGCTCKKSKCLKLYCVCFGASVMCGGNCRCLICHNTPMHEQSRKDAIRCILARNPSAFDTKFKKGDPRLLTNRPLAHKLGCKCRKSFCTKKYCECYNAGVKCSASCRCVSCKNMPPGGFGPNPGKDSHTIQARSFAEDVMRVKNGAPKPPPNSEHKMMHAAQHLAFLKHASPARDVARRGIGASRENSAASMPSLATSSSGTSSSPDAGEKKTIEPPKKSGGVNTLLMAAYAMTELGEKDESNAKKLSRSAPATPEKRKSKALCSPKRKSGTAVVGSTFDDQFADADDMEEDVSSQPEKKGPPIMTPGDMRRVKRTRVGTVERKPPISNPPPAPFDATPRTEKPTTSDSEESEKNNDSSEEQEQPSPETLPKPKDHIMSTPTAQKDAKTIGDLTPVTARCIDFRHMGMGDKETHDEKKDDTVLTTQ